MDRYQRVERARPESAIEENEIRITAQGLIRNYVSYATSLLQDRKIKEIVLKAMGQAISKSVAVAEIIKKRIPGLHQDMNISSVSITDVWEPIEEGLVPLEMTRHVSMISITLSPRELDRNTPGYQAPAYDEQPRQQQHLQQALPPQHQPRRPQGHNQQLDYEDSYARGRGSGRGRGRGRGWGRGGYGGYGGYGNQGGYNQGGGYYDNQGGYGGYDNQGGYGGGYGYNQGRYGNYQENGGYRGRGGMRGRGNYNYRGGYEGNRGGYGSRGGYEGGRGGYRGGRGGFEGGRGGYRGGRGGYEGGRYEGGRDGYEGGRGGGYPGGRGGGGSGGRGRGRMGGRGQGN